MIAARVPVAGRGVAAPQVRLLLAGVQALDGPSVRLAARAATAASAAAYTSRSHRYPYSLIVWHDEPVGVDIERIEPCDAAYLESICTPSERARLGEIADLGGYAAALWCAKEALAKALGDALRYDPRHLESPMGWPGGRAGAWRATELDVAPGHVAWVCWRSRDGVGPVVKDDPAVGRAGAPAAQGDRGAHANRDRLAGSDVVG